MNNGGRMIECRWRELEEEGKHEDDRMDDYIWDDLSSGEEPLDKRLWRWLTGNRDRI